MFMIFRNKKTKIGRELLVSFLLVSIQEIIGLKAFHAPL